MNKADRNYSIQPHGLHYDKRFEGSRYEDGEKTAGCHDCRRVALFHVFFFLLQTQISTHTFPIPEGLL